MNSRIRHICVDLLEKASRSSFFINDILSDYYKKELIHQNDKKIITNMILGSIRLKGRYDFILSNIYNGKYRLAALEGIINDFNQ